MGELWFVDEDGNRGTVSVSRADVESLLYAGGSLSVADHVAVKGIRLALPPKPWEPSDEMVDDYLRSWPASKTTPPPPGRDDARKNLRRMHAAGLFAAWDRMQETDR